MLDVSKQPAVLTALATDLSHNFAIFNTSKLLKDSSSAARAHRQAIALISAHGVPTAEIGSEEAGDQNVYVRQVGAALAKLG